MQPRTNPVSDYCMIASPIGASKNDTLLTKKQILEHNSVYTRLCK